MTRGPLDGVRVLEFSLVYAAPWAGMTLSDMGADVIKVEAPGGEPTRNAGAVLPSAGGKMFTWVNRGKRSLVLDLHDERAQRVVHELVRDIDVVLINYRPGQAARFHIDYATLSAIRPDLIYAEITGFGSQGPLAGQGSTDIIAQSYGGLTAAIGKVDEHGAPWTMNIGCGDISGAAGAVMGIVSALLHRDRTGEGQLVEVSLLRTIMGFTGWLNMRDEANDAVDLDPLRDQLQRMRVDGSSYQDMLAAREAVRAPDTTSPYYANYQTSDGAIALGCRTSKQGDRVRAALQLVEPADIEEASEQLRQRLRAETTEHWLDLFASHDVPAAPVQLPELIGASPRSEHLMTTVEHEALLQQRQVAPVARMSKTGGETTRPSAMLGQHTDEILATLGYTSEAIAGLREAKVIG